MTHVDVQEANKHFLELIERIARGEEIIIDKDEQPFAIISPINGVKRVRHFGSAKGLVQIADILT